MDDTQRPVATVKAKREEKGVWGMPLEKAFRVISSRTSVNALWDIRERCSHHLLLFPERILIL